MTLRLIVLGSGTALPQPERGSSGYVVQCGETVLLLDCGSGTTQRLRRAGYQPSDLSGVFLSHAHIDHLGDLPTLLFAMRVGDPPSLAGFPLHAGVGMHRWIEGLQETFGDWIVPGEETRLELHEHDGTDGGARFEVGELICRVRKVEHHETSLGIRLESPEGARIAYLGDTAPCDAAIELCSGVDLAIVECSYPDGHETDNHLVPRDVARIARAAQPGGILLTHLYPDAATVGVDAQVRKHGTEGVPVKLAHDGLGVELG